MGPLYMNVEPTNACNLRCRTCSIDGSRKKGMMEMGLFHDIIDQAYACGTYEVALFLGGEPLLHQNLPDMVAYVASKGMEARIYTNACMLTEERSKALIDSGLNFLGISFDGDRKEDYESMRIGANYEEVLDNVTTFLKVKKEKGKAKPYVSLLMLKMLDNPSQEISPEFEQRFAGLPIDELTVRNPHNWRGEKGDIELAGRGQHYFPCQVFWSAMSVAWDGRVVGCSADLNGTTIFGDLHDQTIMEIWNGEEMVRHRRLLKQKHYRELPLCAECRALWTDGSPRASVISQLPPFEQLMRVRERLLSRRDGKALDGKDAGAIRTRKR